MEDPRTTVAPTRAPRRVIPAAYGIVILAIATAPVVYYFSTPDAPYLPYSRSARPGTAAVVARPAPAAAPHLSPPKFVKGIYVSSATVSAKTRFGQLMDLVDRTELNAMVIDIKNGKGEIAFIPKSEALKPHAETRSELGDLETLTKPLKEKGIYLIARLFVFQDPALVAARPDLAVHRGNDGVWSDRKGVTWIDAAAKEAWEYNAAIAKEAYAGGFDEVQFDYVRFPTDGKLGVMTFPFYDGKQTKAEVMKDFFAYMDHELRDKEGIPVSADLFGLTMWQHDFDLGIGQRLDTSAPHLDFVSPMVYPSHYPAGFEGLDNPADHPYQIVYDNMVRGGKFLDELEKRGAPGEKIATVRPWIQDFDLGAEYDAGMVREQMRAAAEGGGSGWLLWNARNVYTEGALLKGDAAGN